MHQDPREIESHALEAQRAGNFALAAELWQKLIMIEPRWESGYPYYYLADCCTRLGSFDQAEEAYRRAIEVAPEDELFSVGLQSFLDARKTGALK